MEPYTANNEFVMDINATQCVGVKDPIGDNIKIAPDLFWRKLGM